MAKSLKFSRGLLGGWFAGGLPASWNRMKFENGPEEVVLSLSKGAAKKGYRFDTRDPIWVVIDTGECPQQCGVCGQIQDIKCTATQLTFNNLNDEQVTLRYQVNVLDPSNQLKPIDPIMENGGHGFL